MAKDKSKKKQRSKPEPDKTAPEEVTISGPSEEGEDWESGTGEWALTLEGDSQGLDDLFDDLSSDDIDGEDLADLDSIEAALEQITQSVFDEAEGEEVSQEKESADSDAPAEETSEEASAVEDSTVSDAPENEEAPGEAPDSSSAYFEQIQDKMGDLLNLNFDSIEIEGLPKEEEKEIPPPPLTTDEDTDDASEEAEAAEEIDSPVVEAEEDEDLEPDEPLILDESHWIPDDATATSAPQETEHQEAEDEEKEDVGTLADLMAEIEAEMDKPVEEVAVSQAGVKPEPQAAAISRAAKPPEEKTSSGFKPIYFIIVIAVIAAAYFAFDMMGQTPESEVQPAPSSEPLAEQAIAPSPVEPEAAVEEDEPVAEAAAVVAPEETPEETALTPGERIEASIASGWDSLDGWVEEALQPDQSGRDGGQPLAATTPESLEVRYQHLSLNRSAYNLLNSGIESGALDQFLNNAQASRARTLQASIIDLSELGYCDVAESDLRNSRAAFDVTDNLRDQLLNETQQAVFFCGQQRDSNTWDSEQIQLLTRQANRLDTLITGGSLNSRTAERLDSQRLGTYHQLVQMLRVALKRNLVPSEQVDSASRAHYFFSLKLILDLDRRELNGAVTALVNTVLESNLVPSTTDTADLAALRDQLNEPTTFDQIIYNDLMNQIAEVSTQLPAPQYAALAANQAAVAPEESGIAPAAAENPALADTAEPEDIAAVETEEQLQEEDENAGRFLVSINITSAPSRARIYHGEEVLGRTPFEDEIWVEPGDLQLRVSKSNYHSERLNISVSENTSLSRSLTLREREPEPDEEESGSPFGRTQTMGGGDSFGRTRTMGGE